MLRTLAVCHFRKDPSVGHSRGTKGVNSTPRAVSNSSLLRYDSNIGQLQMQRLI